jgi:hypothetical protein
LALFLSVVRLLGVRTSSATLGFGLLAASLGVLGAGSNGPAATRYELSAPLVLTAGGQVFACFSYDLMAVDSCGGIEVKGVDVSHIPDGGGDHGLPWSQTMRLVGTWDGQALTLTEAPHIAQTAPGPPQPCQQDPNSQPEPDSIQRQIEVIDALRSRGVEVLMSTGCDRTTVGVLVPVADDATVSWLTHHYRVKVAGWLRPLPSGP